MPMCRVRPPMSSPAPIEVIVRHVEVIEPDADLDARLRRFEDAMTKGLLAFDGLFEEGRTYRKDAMVSHHGSLFVANRETNAAPDIRHPDWTLAVKRGRNGRDRRDMDHG